MSRVLLVPFDTPIFLGGECRRLTSQQFGVRRGGKELGVKGVDLSLLLVGVGRRAVTVKTLFSTGLTADRRVAIM